MFCAGRPGVNKKAPRVFLLFPCSPLLLMFTDTSTGTPEDDSANAIPVRPE